ERADLFFVSSHGASVAFLVRRGGDAGRVDRLKAEHPGLRGVDAHAHGLHVGPAVYLQANEVLARDARLVEVQLCQRPVDDELVIVSLDDQHLAVERLRLCIDRADDCFERPALVAELLIERVRVEGEHDGALLRLSCRSEGRLDPGQVRLLAAREFAPVLLDAQLLVVVGAHEVQRREGRAAVGPARVLRELGELGDRVGLPHQRLPLPAEALRLRPEDAAHQRENFRGIGGPAIRLPAIRPLVVARRVDDGSCEAVEELELRLLEGASTVAVALGVADVDRECGMRRVDGVDELAVEGVVGRRGVCRVAERDEAERIGSGRGRDERREEEPRQHAATVAEAPFWCRHPASVNVRAMTNFARSIFAVPALVLGLVASAQAALDRTERAIAKQAAAGQPAAEALLQRVVDIESPTENVAGVRAAGDAFAESGGTRGKRLLLLGHVDTVLSGEKFRREGTRAFGTGTSDMKGGAVVMVQALKALHAAGALKDRRITIMLTGDEEDAGLPLTASRGPMVELAKVSDAALSFEAAIDGTATIGRRGINSWTLETTGQTGHSSGIFGAERGSGAV